jgi:hypothetical protein
MERGVREGQNFQQGISASGRKRRIQYVGIITVMYFGKRKENWRHVLFS